MADLEVTGLTVEYNAGGYLVRPLDGLTFHAQDGELVVLLGPSGCGKTTLLSCLAGILTPTAGSIKLDRGEVVGLQGKALAAYRRDRVGIVFQAFNLIPSLTARGNVMAPMRLAGVGRHEASERAAELLGRVGLEERMHHRPGNLSGGQQQRVAIARALVHDPPLVVADEPTAHLDHVQVEGVLRLLKELASPGRLVIVSTHDDRVSNLADRVIELAPKTALGEAEPESVSLAAGQVLFEQGDAPDFIYVVDRGKIEIFRLRPDRSEERLTIIEPGGYLGELGPVLNMPRSAYARAMVPTDLTAYTVRAFRARFPGTAKARHPAATG